MMPPLHMPASEAADFHNLHAPSEPLDMQTQWQQQVRARAASSPSFFPGPTHVRNAFHFHPPDSHIPAGRCRSCRLTTVPEGSSPHVQL